MIEKTFKITLVSLFIVIGLLLSNTPINAAEQDKTALEKADAKEAIAIANDWKWSRPDVKSYVDAQEVVFEFPDGTKKKIPLPKDQMYVAIAPYVDKTHT
ncbi:MAG TPA: hypothetical protein VHO84_15455 [Syntrophorhabdaceae bacterium]|nr:hypothetical protein [Syntrophorhabdaceae bacterium]